MRHKPQLLQVIQLGHPTIRRVAHPVKDLADDRFQALIGNLIATCQDADGVGIAAPQVDESIRLFIIASRPNARYPNAPLMPPTPIINPKILSRSPKKKKDWEGCLSIPGIYARVPRHTWVRVEYTDRQGKRVKARFGDFIARVFQHEYDHLDGIVFLDRAKSRDIVTQKEYLKQLKRS